MTDRKQAAFSPREHFEKLWRDGDPWQTDTSDFEQAKYAREFELLAGQRYGRVLEIGCGSGFLTRLLATIADEVVAVDIAESAIERARAIAGTASNVEFRVADIMEFAFDEEDRWDLITFGDTVSTIGWSSSFVEVAALVAQLFGRTRPDGRLLMADTYGGVDGVQHQRWIVRTYRDLFLNVGYRLEKDEIFQGAKDGVEIPVLMSLFHKSAHDAEQRERELWEHAW